MRKLFIILVVLALIGMISAPAIDGFLFKNRFQEYISDIAKRIPAQSGTRIELSSYEMGWTHSTAKLIVTVNAKNHGQNSFEIDMTISHGPLVNAGGTWKVAYAYVDYQMKIPYLENTLLRANTLFSLFNNKVITKYTLGKIEIPQFLSSDGFNGELITSEGDKNLSINTFNLGKIENATTSTSMKFIVSPIQFYEETLIDFTNNSSAKKINTITDGFSVELSPSMLIGAKKLLFDSSTKITNQQYQFLSSLHINELQLPLSKNIGIKNLFLQNTLKDFTIINSKQSGKSISLAALIKDSTTPSSRVEIITNFDTPLGATHISIAGTDFEALKNPNAGFENAFMGLKKYHIMVNVKIPTELAEILLTDFFQLKSNLINVATLIAQKNQPMGLSDPSSLVPAQQINPDAKTILAQLVAKRFLIEKDKFYSLDLSVSQEKIIMNAISIANIDELKKSLAEIIMLASQNISTPTPSSSASIPSVITTEKIAAPVTTALASPATPARTYSCYWQQKIGGKFFWVLIKELASKDACFKMDSCSGGKGASNGGCFKWSTSSDAAPQPW